MTGLSASFASAIFSSAKDLFSKRIALKVDGTVSAFASFAFALPFYLLCIAIVFASGHDIFSISGPFLLLVFLRASTDTIAETCKMHAFAHGEVSLVSAIFSLWPLFLMFTSPFLTGDALTKGEIVGVIFVVIGGIVIFYRRDSVSALRRDKGIIFALLASFFFSLNHCFDRLAVQTASPLVSGFAMTLLSAAFLFPVIIRRPEIKTILSDHKRDFSFRGLFEVSFMVSKLYALQFLTAPVVAGVQRISLLFSIIGGKVFFKEGDFLRRFCGGLLIVVGAAVIVSDVLL